MLKEALEARKAPDILKMNDGRTVTSELWRARRAEIMELLRRGEYGFMPPAPPCVRGTVLARELGYAGKATQERVRLDFDTVKGPFAFEIDLVLPTAISPAPVMLHINFRDMMPDKYAPAEEIVDRGFGIAQFCYKNVVNDNCRGDFSDGLGALFIGDRPRDGSEWGKIGMWAYAASRVLDYLLTRPEVDGSRVSVVGHSRLGKTALWCGASDERFFAACSNDSGAGGAAITRQKTGEHVSDFVSSGIWDWFCEDLKQYANREDEMPFDQHFLIALMAPRPVSVASAREDGWADPESEFLSCLAADEAYRLLGKPGLVTRDRFPDTGESLHDGLIGYHLRAGRHYFSRYDWNEHIDFLERVMRR